jgi:hypothetical protein
MQLTDLGISHMIAFRPHHPHHHLEQGEGAAQTLACTVREASQNWRGVPRVGMRVREEPAIQDEDAAYFRTACGFAPLGALKPASEMLQDDKRGRVKGNQRRRLDTKTAPDRLDEIGAFGCGIGIVLGLSLSPMPTYSTNSFAMSAAFGKCG